MRLFNILIPAVLIALVLFMGFYNLGEVPYRDFFVVQMPLSIYLTAGLFRLFGPEVWWARAASFLLILGTGFLICAASIKFFGFSRNLRGGGRTGVDGLSGVHRPRRLPYPRQGPGHGPLLRTLCQRPNSSVTWS
jgi:hypothetical protein